MILGKYGLAAGPLGVMNLAILLREVRGGDLVCSLSLGEHRLQTGVVEKSRTRIFVSVWTPGPYRVAHRVEG
jgi:hypothetical protein